MIFQLIEYIPILTTTFSVFFFYVIFRHYLSKPGRIYLLWWSIGVLTFGIGTMTESINALFGWHEINFKFWYISGALLGGAPLAQGTVYLLMKKKFADWSTIIICTIIIVGAICVILSPVVLPENFDQRLTGSVLEWSWVRFFSPFINTYALIFLVGGAFYSAFQYAKRGKNKRFIGNIYIAVGALLPGIGGTFTRFGLVEMLYLTELTGLIMIYIGYNLIRKDKAVSVHTVQES